MRIDSRKFTSTVVSLGSLAPVLVFALVFSPGNAARAQNREQNREQSATYVSQIDRDLTIRKVAVIPVVDNVEGIYSRPVESQLTQLVKSAHRWDFVEAPMPSVPTQIELEENPEEVVKAARNVDADALLGAAVSKGPGGLSIRLNLYLKKDGKLLAQEVLRDHPRFELAEVRERVSEMYRRVVARLPYEGIIMSRQQNRVTINLGKSDGVTKDQVITAIQVISVTRHPKFNFLISTEKEILGRIKILKVDDTLSFGSIVAEKERGAIQKLAKVSGITQVVYQEPASLGEGPTPSDLKARPDSKMTFGENPREWLPIRPPAFGSVAMRVGLGSYKTAAQISGGANLEGEAAIYPSIGIAGELWLNPNWTVRADILQGVMSVGSPRGGSTLNHAMSRYSMEGVYNFLLRDDFFGPKIQLSAGFASYKMFVDDSTPQAFTSTNYSGLTVGIGGSFPLDETKIWYVGGRMNLFLLTSLSESPTSSGSSSQNSLNEFMLTAEKKIAENLRATGALEFSLYGSSFTGTGTRRGASSAIESASTTSQRHTVVSGGVVYMF